jgi:hypothetical protein
MHPDSANPILILPHILGAGVLGCFMNRGMHAGTALLSLRLINNSQIEQVSRE